MTSHGPTARFTCVTPVFWIWTSGIWILKEFWCTSWRDWSLNCEEYSHWVSYLGYLSVYITYYMQVWFELRIMGCLDGFQAIYSLNGEHLVMHMDWTWCMTSQGLSRSPGMDLSWSKRNTWLKWMVLDGIDGSFTGTLCSSASCTVLLYIWTSKAAFWFIPGKVTPTVACTLNLVHMDW